MPCTINGKFKSFRFSMPDIPQCIVGSNLPQFIRTVIDDDVKSLRGIKSNLNSTFDVVLKALLTQRNNVAAINLHKEILLRIFRMVASEWTYESLISISHTCAYWRETCLANASLWNFVDLSRTPPAVVEEFLLRSKDSLLVVKTDLRVTEPHEGDCRCLTVKDQINMITQHSARIRYLCVLVSDEEGIQSLLPDSEPVPAFPKLNTFSIEAENLACLGAGWFDAPLLEDLRLVEVRPFWSQGFGAKLIRLSIVMHSDEDPTVDDDGTDIFEVFEDSPFLEELTIVHTQPLMPKCVSRSISGQKPLPLQHLRRLHLELPSSDLISILSSITTSKELEMVLITSSDSRSTPPISSESARLLPSDPRCVPCLSRVLCLHLDIAAFVLEGFSHPLL